MTTLREAAQQALEQLKINRINFRKGPSKSICKMLAGGNDEVILALEAALAEPVQEQDIEDAIEAAYWQFDCRRSGLNEWASAPQSERDAFKAEARKLVRGYFPTRQALAEPVQAPAQQDNETIAQTFSGLPKRKLRELLAAGWQINGVCFQRTEEDGTVRRGAATTGGMVLWWNQEQPAQQQEPVAWMVYTLDGKSVCVTDSPSDFTPEHRALPLYTAPPQRKPLTEDEILSVLRLAPPEPSLWPHLKDEAVVGDVQRAVLAIARAIEQAHGIKERA